MKILVVEDEQELLRELSQNLREEGFLTEVATTFSEGEEKVKLFAYDLVILDISLPDGNGLDLLEKLKEEHPETGVIILSAKNSLDDKVDGLDLGADDYLTKPFHFVELNARIKSVFRRRGMGGRKEIQIENLSILPDEKAVQVEEEMSFLTKKEYELLLFLVLNRTKILSKAQIAEHLWGDFADSFDDFDFIYTHIKNLRKKLKTGGALAEIKTIYGLGYQFCRA